MRFVSRPVVMWREWMPHSGYQAPNLRGLPQPIAFVSNPVVHRQQNWSPWSIFPHSGVHAARLRRSTGTGSWCCYGLRSGLSPEGRNL